MHINCIQYAHKLHTIKITNYSYRWTLLHVSGINHQLQGHINTKPYILLQHQMYIHNFKIHKSSYKYDNVANMDSMMLTYFRLRLISMSLFTMCVVITHTHIKYRSFWSKRSSPCACTDVSCVGESCMNNTKERIELFICREKVSKDAKNVIWWIKLCGQTALWECFVSLHHFFNQPQMVSPFCTPQCYPWSNMGMNVLKMGGCVLNCDYSNDLPGFIQCEEFLNVLCTWYHFKKKSVHGISSILLPTSMSSHKAETVEYL
jgi:hypothetical protein